MGTYFFASDLHGRISRYAALFAAIRREVPFAVLLGGDLLPGEGEEEFVEGVLARGFRDVLEALGSRSPRVFLIAGNDDPRSLESRLDASPDLWTYIHGRRADVGCRDVYGYSCVPPTPFLLKDWERYDVSSFVEPGSVSPEEGIRTAPADPMDVRYGTIEKDLARLAGDAPLHESIFLFHAPPYQTSLDRAALDGVLVDHAPLDVHVGSIAIRRFIEERQPLVTLHGHIHESARITGRWRDRIGRTLLFGAAHDGPELALVRFDPDAPDLATRELIGV